MTYTSGNPAPMMTPEAKLADKQWRRTNSWWIFPSLLSCGFLCWLGFLVAAIRTGKRKYWIFAGFYATVFAVFVALVSIADGDKSSTADNVAGFPLAVAWIAPTIHAAILNREYLRTLAAKGAWYQTPSTHVGQPAPTFLGVSQDNYYAPNTPAARPYRPAPAAPTYVQPPPPQQRTPTETQPAQPVSSPVHANTATAAILAQLPGVSPALAQRIVAVRDARGGYRNIDDLAAAANLQPHELIRVRNHLTFDQDNSAQPQNDTPTQPGPTGRILDI